MNLPPARLSCQQCQRRKTKCDKQQPACSACVKDGFACTIVQRHRLPRGRTSKKYTRQEDLKTRIERLEAALSRIPPESHVWKQNAEVPERTKLDPFIAPDFWEELTETVAGMRNILESPTANAQVERQSGEEEEDDDEALAATSGQHAAQTSTHQVLFSTAQPVHLLRPSEPDLEQHLFEVYHTRVDAIFKVIHWPSAVASLKQSDQYNDDQRALRSAICFTAACSLFDHELHNRSAIVTFFRKAAETAFIDTELLTTLSIVILQAFVIYLAGLRACQANALQWTLTATAIRIAQAQGIPSRFSSEHSFDDELRRRLWCCIGLLDMQSAFDRGSNPLLKSSDFEALPSEINDDDMSPSLITPSPSEGRFTEISFSLLVYRAGICQRKLTELGLLAASGSADPSATRKEQIMVLHDFKRHVRHTAELCDTPPSLIQAYTNAVAQESLVAMRLLLHRPLHRRGPNRSCKKADEEEEIDILSTATEVLERSNLKRTEIQFAQWAWFSWVKWYALAVVLAELCAIHTSYADHSWEVAQRSYEDYANAVADTKSGLLWEPIAKLMLRVKEIRDHPSISTASKHQRETPLIVRTEFGTIIDASASVPNVQDLTEESVNDISLLQSDSLYGDSLQDTDDVAWIHWDMLIDDINNSGLINDGLSGGS